MIRLERRSKDLVGIVFIEGPKASAIPTPVFSQNQRLASGAAAGVEQFSRALRENDAFGKIDYEDENTGEEEECRLATSIVPPSSAILSWSSVTSKTYALEFATDLRSNAVFATLARISSANVGPRA